MKKLEQFKNFEIKNPKYIFGGDGDDGGPVVDKTKKKIKGNGIDEEENDEGN